MAPSTDPPKKHPQIAQVSQIRSGKKQFTHCGADGLLHFAFESVSICAICGSHEESCSTDDNILPLSSGEALSDRRPVDDVPERRDIIGPAVLVLQIVRVFPNVEAEDRRACRPSAGCPDSACSRSTSLPSFAADEPGPAGAESAAPALANCFLEIVEAAERALDGVGQRAGRLAAARLVPITVQNSE